ncbi:hypothetical protein IW261DRAFT_1480157, partial [Armillaria novae-zelandiae]
IYYHFKCRALPPQVKTYSNICTIVNLHVFSSFSGLRSSPRVLWPRQRDIAAEAPYFYRRLGSLIAELEIGTIRESLMDPIDVSVTTRVQVHNCDSSCMHTFRARMGASAAQGKSFASPFPDEDLRAGHGGVFPSAGGVWSPLSPAEQDNRKRVRTYACTVQTGEHANGQSFSFH